MIEQSPSPAALAQSEFIDVRGDIAVLPGRHRRPGSDLSAEDSLKSLGLELEALSGGSVERFSGLGPVLVRRRESRRQLRRSTFVNALSRSDRALITVMSGAWLGCLVIFWSWWLEPVHRAGIAGLVVNSLVLGYLSGFPVFFVIGANRLRKVNSAIAVPFLRVAFVVTHAPSEPWAVVRETLEAMLAQDYPLPYDIWLCSERPTGEIVDWCVARGVGVSTRSGEPGYHRENWPRRTRCKEGNLAYFYDRWGYRHYDVIAQLDCDHVPARGYLAEMVRPFSDPAIGYVAAPSVCDANAVGSWAARGRLHKEATFHGPFQLGHSDGFAPLCIGSHYAVRTEALRQIGGIGPELAEDFSTTFLLNAAGWQGAFAIDAEAHGDGPNTFAAMTVQEFQWARSLTTVLFGLVPRNMRRLPWLLRLRFVYALSYYSLLVGSTLAGVMLAPVAVVLGLAWINVNYLAFLAHWGSISIWLILLAALLRRRGLLRPPRAPIVSWENWLYSLSRWPFVGLGICAGMLQIVRPRPIAFKVTPKSVGGLEPLPAKLVLPFVAISIVSSSAALYGEHFSAEAGYVFLSALAGTVYAVVSVMLSVRHVVEIAAKAGTSVRAALRSTVRVPLLFATCALGLAMPALILYPAYAIKMFGS
ncbi:MAG TPA: glycosyltransferase family 2 protein [Streptosporangiaceae bacterium]|nr:glycosyltransferase family 2 protein [Streptosporangiaceae bacterium]